MGTQPRRERKVISVVFADLVGFTARSETLDPEDVEAFLRPYHERLRAEFERFGGSVEKFIGDAVVAVFGAPIAHEDDQERAVRAALAIRDAIREEAALEVRIAVNTGEAIVRLDADPQSGEGIATGDVLNTASRLQAAAPVNGILVGEPTYNATRDVISYEPAPAVEAKGKAEPIPVWEAVEARSRLGVDVRQSSPVPLVGRERERSILLDTLARAEAELTPQLVTLVGVPGIGKSRLVYELLATLEQSDELRYWRQGRSLPYGEGVSFWALGEMVKAQAGILDGDAPAVAADKLERAVAEVAADGDAAWVTQALGPLVGLGGSNSDGAAGRREESFAAWRRFFESMAERRPLVLVFEDLHWADDGLLDFIDHLIDWATGVPILVICTTRPELLERRPGWAGGKPNALTLGVSPLSDTDSAKLLSLVLGTPVLAAETQAALLERASGNPLYAEQFARLLVERGSIENVPVPENIQGLIAARLDTLSAAEKAVLQDAAVIGKVFWSGALLEDDRRSAILHGLDRKEFIRRERRASVAGEDEYAFRHGLVRDVAYGQIPRADRLAKHLRVAAWIEGLDRPQDTAELAAHHYSAASQLGQGILPEEVRGRARASFEHAGDHAFALGADASALGHYRMALELLPADDPGRPRLLYRFARAEERSTGDAAGLSAAVDELIEAGDTATAAEAEAILTLNAWQHADREGWQLHLDRALALVRDAPPSAGKASVLATRARYTFLAGDAARAFPMAQEALAMAQALNLGELQAHALNTLGLASRAVDVGDGYQEMRASIALSESANSTEALVAWNNLSSLFDTDGLLAEAEAAWRESERVARRFGAAGYLRWVRYGALEWLFMLGRWDEAMAEADELVAAQSEATPHYLSYTPYAVRARIETARGDDARALADMAVALELSRRIGDPQAVIPALALAIVTHTAAGEGSKARERLDEFMVGQGSGQLAFRAPAEVVGAVDSLGRGEEFLALFAGRRRTPWLDAAERIVVGDWPGAADVYDRIGSPTDEAFAHLRAAEALVAAGRRTEADVHLRDAVTFYGRVRASRYVAQVEALRAATA
jgi:class 3 adenylate cyclase/tetratricopeptide (TPR) repeat protein